MNKKFIVLTIIAILFSASLDASSQDETSNSNMCIAVFGYQISPKGELEKFEVSTDHKCGDGVTTVEVSDAWYKTACGFFSTQNRAPTYRKRKKPKQKWAFFYINAENLDRVYPSLTSGSSDEDPFIYVQDSILDDDSSSHACNNITKRTK